MNDSLVKSTPTFRLCSDPNPILVFFLPLRVFETSEIRA